jgi:hypothetical protein
MRPSDLTSSLISILPTGRPVYLTGAPGVGKSQVIQRCAADLGIDFFDFRPLLHDPSDLKFPIVDVAERTVHWVNTIFPKDPAWKGVIALEEVGLCPPLMQGALYQLALDRQIGDYRLPEGAWVVATSNRQEDRAGVGRVSTALTSRFVQLDLEVSLEDWLAWAAENGVRPELRAFLNYRPDLLHQFDPATNAKTFPCPRTWHFASDLLHVPPRLLHAVVSGCVGEAAAVELVGFLQVYRDLPDLDDVLKNPRTTTVPATKPAVLYALCGALAERSKALADLDNLAAFGMRLPEEFSALLLRDTFQANSSKAAGKVKGHAKLFTGEMSKYLAKHRSVLIDKN